MDCATVSDGTEIYYQDVGSGPAVVLVHGFSGNHLTWYRQVPTLAGEYRCVVPDQRSFGLSRDATGAGVGAFADDLLDVLDELGIERAVLVGHSMGGWTVGSVATQRPDRVAGLVLSATPGGLLPPNDHRGLITDATAVPEVDPLSPEEQFLDESIDGLNVEAPEEWEETRAVLDGLPLDHEPIVEAGVPALVLAGEADEFMPPAAMTAVADRLDAETATVEGAGHTVHFERPDEFNRLLVEFLDEHVR
jgi:pimeloyl-ACP methyl ester carboxylesterase